MLPKTFRFSPLTSLLSIALALVMVRASIWQWSRYHEKLGLVASYQSNEETPPLVLETVDNGLELKKVITKKVKVSGEYDFSREMTVINRSHATGPGGWLLTPLKLAGSDLRLIVSRGFIPFSKLSQKQWPEYHTQSPQVVIEGIVQESKPHRSLLSPGSDKARLQDEFNTRWLYPDLEKMAEQFPYPIVKTAFLQKLGGPTSGEFPAESISIDVPPSTHFWYSIEWCLLACASLLVGFLLQAFPRNRTRKPSSRALSCLFCFSSLLAASAVPCQAIQLPKNIPELAKIEEHLETKVSKNISLQNSAGESLTLGSLLDGKRPLIIAPVYYECPELCTLTQQGLLDAVNKIKLSLGEDFKIASISFNPKETAKESQKKANIYRSQLLGKQANKGSSWHFLTGKEAQVKKLMSELGFAYTDDGKDYIHSAVMMILTPDGVVSRYVYGIRPDAEKLRLALVDAAAGKIGNALDKIFLYCFRYDHIEGRYTLAIWNVTRVVCVSGLCVLFGFLVFLRRRENRSGMHV